MEDLVSSVGHKQLLLQFWTFAHRWKYNMVGAWLQMLHKLMGDDSIKKHSHKKLSPLLLSAAVLENTNTNTSLLQSDVHSVRRKQQPKLSKISCFEYIHTYCPLLTHKNHKELKSSDYWTEAIKGGERKGWRNTHSPPKKTQENEKHSTIGW